MNDTCEEGCHTDTQQFLLIGQLLLLSPLPVLRVCEFQMYPFDFLAASHLSTHLSTHSSRANKKRKAHVYFARVGAGLDYDANRQMLVEQRNLKTGLISFTFIC